MKILILEFRQETNTFNPIIDQISAFNAGGPCEGPEIFQARMVTNSAVRGAVEVFRHAGMEVIPTVFMEAPSGGRVADKALQYLMERVADYARNTQFDAIYASLHGATCTESDDDACGTLVEFLRKLAGNKPVATSFDLHANITEKLLQHADIVCGYQTYPHRDYYETGRRAATLCVQLLEGKRFVTASATIPMLLPPAGYNSDEGPFGALMAAGKAMIADGTLLDFTLFPVQPWLDIPEITSRTVAIARDKATAKSCADRLAQALCDMRFDAQMDLLTVDEIIDIAEQNQTGKPVIISEFADSPNGGCVGDSPVVAMRVLERNSKLRTALFVRDPAAVEHAFALGVGGKGTFSIGAGYTPGMPGPLVAEGVVCSLHDGHFIVEGPANRGAQGYLGPSAVVRCGTVDLLVCNYGAHSGDPQLYRHFGIEPSLYDLVVVKANTSFRLPYSKISPLIYNANTPGAGAADLKRFFWTKLPADLFPFVENISPQPAKIW